MPGAGTEEPKPPQAPEPKRFRDEVEVVGEAPSGVEAPAELPVRPAVVTAVAGAADNVFRTLQTLPGIGATSEFDRRLSVRGGSPDENLTITDGVEIHNPYRLLGLTSAFDPELVRSFDLYAGVSSARYGDRLSSLLVVENRPGSTQRSFSGSAALSLTDADPVRRPREGLGAPDVRGEGDGGLPARAGRGGTHGPRGADRGLARPGRGHPGRPVRGRDRL